MKSFDYCRVNESAAFYVKLIEMTMRDVAIFVLLILSALVMFAGPRFIISGTWVEESSFIQMLQT